jgi:hypothetical protein
MKPIMGVLRCKGLQDHIYFESVQAVNQQDYTDDPLCWVHAQSEEIRFAIFPTTGAIFWKHHLANYTI